MDTSGKESAVEVSAEAVRLRQLAGELSDVAKRVKPRLRGVSHQYAFLVSLVAGGALIATAPPGIGSVAATVYAASLSFLLGTSALYHRVNWSPRGRVRMRRLDHSMIFVLIAGTYTPFALLALKGALGTAVLVVMWSAALGGVVMKLCWIHAPYWVASVVYVAVGGLGVAVFPQLADAIGPVGVSLLAGGGVLYVAGAAIYAVRRPDPIPHVFGYHEIFHALVIAAAALHFTAVAGFALPLAA